MVKNMCEKAFLNCTHGTFYTCETVMIFNLNSQSLEQKPWPLGKNSNWLYYKTQQKDRPVKTPTLQYKFGRDILRGETKL
jgi:hypothetical protein